MIQSLLQRSVPLMQLAELWPLPLAPGCLWSALVAEREGRYSPEEKQSYHGTFLWLFGRGRPSATRPAAVLSRPDNPAQSVVSHP